MVDSDTANLKWKEGTEADEWSHTNKVTSFFRATVVNLATL